MGGICPRGFIVRGLICWGFIVGRHFVPGDLLSGGKCPGAFVGGLLTSYQYFDTRFEFKELFE